MFFFWIFKKFFLDFQNVFFWIFKKFFFGFLKSFFWIFKMFFLDFQKDFFGSSLPTYPNTFWFQKNLLPEFIIIFESIFFWNKKVLVYLLTDPNATSRDVHHACESQECISFHLIVGVPPTKSSHYCVVRTLQLYHRFILEL